jgi:hypothetical protein
MSLEGRAKLSGEGDDTTRKGSMKLLLASAAWGSDGFR